MTVQHPTPPPSKRSITLPLIRKRSEHNSGLVSTLEEMALHQEEIQSIGVTLGRTCGKTLKILLLQNNVIDRLECSEMKYFKVLEYLNLALNNITRIEGLGGMECLKKLDLTLNFIPIQNLEKSVDDLTGCEALEELFLIGNPCMGAGDDGGTDESGPAGSSSQSTAGWSGCRAYIIARLINLRYLDGKEIKRSERIIAMQKLPALTDELRRLSKEQLELEQQSSNESPSQDLEIIDENTPTHHNPQTRTAISNEMYAQKQSKEKQENANLVQQKGEKEWTEEHNAAVLQVRQREESNELKANGEIKQCNQGKYKFWFEESTTTSNSTSGNTKNNVLVMKIALPKHLSTSLVDVDIHPSYVSIVVKSKILRVLLPAEVVSNKAEAKRIAATGILELTMPIADGKSAIGMPFVRGSKSDSKVKNVDQNRVKRERLGDSIIKEAITMESLGGIVAHSNMVSEEEEDDEPPPLY